MSTENKPAGYASPFDAPGILPPSDEQWAAKRRIADAARALTEALVTTTADTSMLNAIADAMLTQVGKLQQQPRVYGRSKFERLLGHDAPLGSLGYELNPIDGQSNPIASNFDIWFEGDRIHGRVKMGWQYEGPPNCVHGGMVAALFDQFLGVGQKLTGQPGFTGILKTRYIKPTPIDTELRLEGWVERVEGRKNVLKGEMWAGDVNTASCEGVFISIPQDVIDELKASR
jgi:hypothetical protein